MDVTISQSTFERALSVAGRAVPSRATLPTLTHVLLQAEPGRLKVAGTDLNLAIITWEEALVSEPGGITVPAKPLAEFISALPDEPIHLRVHRETWTLQIVCGSYETAMKGLDPEEYPILPDLEGDGFALDPEDFRLAIDQVTFAAAADETRPILTGVLIRWEEGHGGGAGGAAALTLAAADGYRLSVKTLPVLRAPVAASEPGSTFSVIVPASTLKEVGRILKGETEPVSMMVLRGRNQVGFRLSRAAVLSQLIEGQFPDFQAIIPKRWETRVEISREALWKACKALSVFARETSNAVRLALIPGEGDQPGQVLLQSRSPEKGETRVAIDALVEGNRLEIAFNVRFLMDVLEAIEGDWVAFEMTTPQSPVKVLSVGDPSFVHVVMPMFL
ncbi:DNA polymerase III subunit beta [Thermoflexus sp.]|uniref:DNA polymerase III subunit beta n=1 Tax=Thermoflexus sp. TaxID=1969742 RepID=UPI0025EA05FB|nr:DNA polymerase III subunit beta [Thermoflexus sp.]MDW8180051.1 DNA polymerase III subunit beta [Anaerolineae bacterium]MCS6962955.1 DNA polymerase III subunit beta [Thermoflexus sp.]MCS7350600.1 DNA polymerase III subunit beta [Thermoflexus sp.]MCX7690683.1 DNA polymerase III subunit beta [Thermoflexus sp.]MDW8184016.1 DNA polymerase III subunit beta [Anaerolineae bacterium]